jgi:hypothetical protein
MANLGHIKGPHPDHPLANGPKIFFRGPPPSASPKPDAETEATPKPDAEVEAKEDVPKAAK